MGVQPGSRPGPASQEGGRSGDRTAWGRCSPLPSRCCWLARACGWPAWARVCGTRTVRLRGVSSDYGASGRVGRGQRGPVRPEQGRVRALGDGGAKSASGAGTPGEGPRAGRTGGNRSWARSGRCPAQARNHAYGSKSACGSRRLPSNNAHQSYFWRCHPDVTAWGRGRGSSRPRPAEPPPPARPDAVARGADVTLPPCEASCRPHADCPAAARHLPAFPPSAFLARGQRTSLLPGPCSAWSCPVTSPPAAAAIRGEGRWPGFPQPHPGPAASGRSPQGGTLTRRPVHPRSRPSPGTPGSSRAVLCARITPSPWSSAKLLGTLV